MPYITSIERLGREEGLQQGLQQGALEEGRELVLETLTERFGNVPAVISQTLHHIQDQNRLRALLRQTIRSASLEEFQHGLNDK